jgi:hypothetical protein
MPPTVIENTTTPMAAPTARLTDILCDVHFLITASFGPLRRERSTTRAGHPSLTILKRLTYDLGA